MLEKFAQVQQHNFQDWDGLDIISASRFFPLVVGELIQRTIGRTHRYHWHIEAQLSQMPYFSQQVAVIDSRKLTD